jgi:hypothetical protein
MFHSKAPPLFGSSLESIPSFPLHFPIIIIIIIIIIIYYYSYLFSNFLLLFCMFIREAS